MIELLARLGYASKAIVYGIVGLLAILTAVNRGGRITDTSGALRVVLRQPFGRMALIVLAVGLCGYAAWRLMDAVTDPDRAGTAAKGLAVRVGNAIRGCIYGALGMEAFRLLGGLGGSQGDEAEVWTARILDVPLGGMAIAVVGIVVAIYGLTEVVGSVRGKKDEKVDLSSVRPSLHSPLLAISRFGVGIRGGLIVTLGIFLVRAAIHRDPNEAAGSRESMARLGGLVDGRWFLLLIAAGVLAYAVDQALHARCRRIRTVL